MIYHFDLLIFYVRSNFLYSCILFLVSRMYFPLIKHIFPIFRHSVPLRSCKWLWFKCFIFLARLWITFAIQLWIFRVCTLYYVYYVYTIHLHLQMQSHQKIRNCFTSLYSFNNLIIKMNIFLNTITTNGIYDMPI